MIIKLNSRVYRKFETYSGTVLVQVIPQLYAKSIAAIEVGTLIEYEDIVYKIKDRTASELLIEVL